MEVLEKIGPNDRITEFEDIRRCVNRICDLLKTNGGNGPAVQETEWPDGVKITFHLVDGVIYTVMSRGGQKKVVSVDEATEYLMTSYLLTDNGLELLADAVLELGEPHTFSLSKNTFLKIVPTKDENVIVEFVTE